MYSLYYERKGLLPKISDNVCQNLTLKTWITKNFNDIHNHLIIPELQNLSQIFLTNHNSSDFQINDINDINNITFNY